MRWEIDGFVRSFDFRCKALFGGYAELVRIGEVLAYSSSDPTEIPKAIKRIKNKIK